MDNKYPPQESAPPYPGPPLNYGSTQPGWSSAAPPPVGYQGPPYYPPTAASGPVVTQMVIRPELNDIPGQIVCPFCQQTVVTKTQHKTGLLTWAICCGLAVFGCFLCSCIPFCIDSSKDVEHCCSDCSKVVYLYKRIK